MSRFALPAVLLAFALPLRASPNAARGLEKAVDDSEWKALIVRALIGAGHRCCGLWT